MRRRPLLLVVLVLVVVAVCCSRLVDGDDGDDGGGPAEREPGADRPVAPDPAVERPSRAPETAPGTPPAATEAMHADGDLVTGAEGIDPAAIPEALGVAEDFARAWSGPEPEPARLDGVTTPALAASLTEPLPDPPAGSAYLLFDAPEWARVGVPTEQGTIVLDVVLVGGGWLVSALAWWPAGEAP